MKKRIAGRLLCALLLLCAAAFVSTAALAVPANDLSVGKTLQPGDEISLADDAAQCSYSYFAGSNGSLEKEVSGIIKPGGSHRLLSARRAGLEVNDGWEFSGWYCVMTDGQLNISAQYSPQPQVILSDKCLKYGVTASAQRMSKGGTVTVTVAEEYAPYVTAVTVNGEDARLRRGVWSFTMPDGSANVDIEINESACHVVFDAAGGKFADRGTQRESYIEVSGGFALVTGEEAPTRKYYIFGGWLWQGTLCHAGESVALPVQPFDELVMTALWLPDPETAATLSFDARGGSAEQTELLVAPGESAVLPAAWMEGYSFLGWCSRPDGTGDMYAAGSSYAVEEDCTLYACWSAATCTVTVSVKHLDKQVTDITSIQLKSAYGSTIVGHDNGTGVYVFLNVPDGEYTLTITQRGRSGACGGVTVRGGKVVAALLELEMWG